MTVLPILAVGILMNVVAILFVLVSVVLVLLILVQKGRGGGLSAAFGGGMASGLLGSKTGDFLTWATITVVTVFLVLAVLLAKYYRPSVGAEYSVPQTSAKRAQPADTGAAVPQAQPPAPQPGAATTPAPEPNGAGG